MTDLNSIENTPSQDVEIKNELSGRTVSPFFDGQNTR